METRLELEILPQPDDFTCGPTCLHAMYRYYGRNIPLDQLIREVRRTEDGGTMAVLLACHALRLGYQSTLYTYNVGLFDPTWFATKDMDLTHKLKAQYEAKPGEKLRVTTEAYLEYFELGGRLRFEDLTTSLLLRYLRRGQPVLAGLSATYLYRSPREFGPKDDWDDIRGEPSGHFVVICGWDRVTRRVLVADPLTPNPAFENTHYYWVSIDRLVCAILLGILTLDANLLILQPGKPTDGALNVDPDHR